MTHLFPQQSPLPRPLMASTNRLHRTKRIFLLPSLPSLLLAPLAAALMLAVSPVRCFPPLRHSYGLCY
jgi:hypothetical protein